MKEFYRAEMTPAVLEQFDLLRHSSINRYNLIYQICVPALILFLKGILFSILQ